MSAGTATDEPSTAAGAPSVDDPSREPGFWRRWFGPLTAWRVVGLVLAFAFLGGTLGWVVRDTAARTARNEVDIGFARDMLAHHDQAVEMALSVMGDPTIPAPVVDFAQEVVIFQRYEIGLFDDALARWGQSSATGGRSMAWVGEPVPTPEMPGMADREEMSQLLEADGPAAAELFIALMSRHHQGAIAMAEYQAEHGKDDIMRNLGRSIARKQAVEIREYSQLRRRLGLAVPPGYTDPPTVEAHGGGSAGVGHHGDGG